MKQTIFAKTGSGTAAAVSTAFALILAVTMAACSGKAQSSAKSGGNAGADLKQAADAVKGAAKEVKGAVSKAAAGKPADAGDFVYKLNKARNGVIITGIQKDAKFGANLVVPAEIEGFPVVAYLASSNSLSDAKKRDQLVSVVLPDSITYLGVGGINYYDEKDQRHNLEEEYGVDAEYRDINGDLWAKSAGFSQCASLQSIIFPKNLKIIPQGFAGRCPKLKAEGITWPEALEVIGGSAFYGNSFTELVIPNGVKYIGGDAFKESKTLTSVTIPDSVVYIGDWAFENCPELATVKMPAHPIKYVHNPLTFWGCPKLGIAAQKAIKDTGYTGRFN